MALLKAGADPNARPAGYTALHAITWVRKPIRGDGDPPPAGSGKLNSLDIVKQLVAQRRGHQRAAGERENPAAAGSPRRVRRHFYWRRGLRTFR